MLVQIAGFRVDRTKDDCSFTCFATRRHDTLLSYGKGYRVCREYGLFAKRRRPRSLTKADPKTQKSEDLVNREFGSNRPGAKWFTDITEITCKDGKSYLCGILDGFDSALLGFSMSDQTLFFDLRYMRAKLCTSALISAANRYGHELDCILQPRTKFEIDRGSQFTSNQLVLGQVKINDKSNEIKAVPELLEILYLKGCIVTTDAMGCQKEISKKVTNRKADYVLSLKENHPDLYNDVKFYFENERVKKTKVTEDKKHRRIEKREYYLETSIDWLNGRDEWTNLNAIGMVKSTVLEKDKLCEETRYFMADVLLSAFS